VAAQEALAADDDAGAHAALDQLVKASEGELKRLSTLARDAADLTERRTAFQSLSEEVVSGDTPPGHSVVFCPMAAGGNGASWLQKEGEVRNPYFGSAMLHCGIVREKK
jgi:Cu(I)/Ag(I) efflux system membrane fusion protein